MSLFEDIPVRSNGDTNADASWWNTIRTKLIAAFPNVNASTSPFTILNNQSSLVDITGLLLNSSAYTYYKIRYRIRRSSDTPLNYFEVGTIEAWWDGSAWNYKRSVDIGNALGDGAGSESGDYQVGGADSIQIDASTGQAGYLSNNMSGGGYDGSLDWRITESWAV